MSGDLNLTELQLAVLRVLWDRGECTVAEVHAGLSEERSIAMTTVATLLKRLEKRGVVVHRTEGRQFVYRASVAEDDARRSMVRELVDRLFGGDASELVTHLLRAREVRPGDLAKIERMLRERE